MKIFLPLLHHVPSFIITEILWAHLSSENKFNVSVRERKKIFKTFLLHYAYFYAAIIRRKFNVWVEARLLLNVTLAARIIFLRRWHEWRKNNNMATHDYFPFKRQNEIYYNLVMLLFAFLYLSFSSLYAAAARFIFFRKSSEQI